MARYFFSIHGGMAIPDPDGQECSSLGAAKDAAKQMAYDFARNKRATEILGAHISVTDATGAEVFQTPLSLVDYLAGRVERRR